MSDKEISEGVKERSDRLDTMLTRAKRDQEIKQREQQAPVRQRKSLIWCLLLFTLKV